MIATFVHTLGIGDRAGFPVRQIPVGLDVYGSGLIAGVQAGHPVSQVAPAGEEHHRGPLLTRPGLPADVEPVGRRQVAVEQDGVIGDDGRQVRVRPLLPDRVHRMAQAPEGGTEDVDRFGVVVGDEQPCPPDAQNGLQRGDPPARRLPGPASVLQPPCRPRQRPMISQNSSSVQRLPTTPRNPFQDRVLALQQLATALPRIEAALIHGPSNAVVEFTNTKLRLLIRTAYGFREPEPLIALALLDRGGPWPSLPGGP